MPYAPALSSTKKANLTIKLTKDTKATGYEIVYSTSSKFESSKSKTVTLSKNTLISKSLTLKAGTKYYVKARSYVTVDGKKIYGDYSAVKNITVKK